ncbi:hypothetical protein AGMMS49587_01000 [Spirochaetia bacterium]|nr:hypothetical protein AGMMS49587_01000 [Spirochaetia bacterium]
MKIKYLFIIFNAIIILFLLTICLMPLFTTGQNFVPPIWRSLRPMALIPGLVLIVLDIFYFSNRRLFALLERGDYPALVGYLEMRVLRRGHYFSPLVRLLANSYLAMADTTGVSNLENKVAVVKPALLESNALVFGVARILGGDLAGAVRFFAARLPPGEAGDRNAGRRRVGSRALPWVRWYYGFSLLLDRQFSPAAEQFKPLAEGSPDTLIVGLSAYFLGTTLQRNTENGLVCLAAAQGARSRIQETIRDKAGWLAKAGKLKHEVHTVILQKYIEEAGDWLFGG